MGWHVVFMIAMGFNLVAAALGLFVLKPMRARHFAATAQKSASAAVAGARPDAACAGPLSNACAHARQLGHLPARLDLVDDLGAIMTPANPAAAAAPAASTTADNTLQPKSRDAGVVSGGHLVAKALKNEGVDTIFTLCGGHIIDIYDGCIDEGIRIIDVRHEQVAAHAADGYARQTGKLGCVVTTAGPGCTNAMTGIATAFRSESPVLHIGGQGALTQHKMGSLQDLPHVELLQPITKFAASVPSTERVADMISMAAREAFNGATGPVYLEIPRDVLDREVELSKAVIPKPGHYRASTKSIGDPRDIEKLADILVNSERPAILYGQQVWSARGHEEAIALLRGLDIPGYFNGGSRGLLPPGDPHHFDRTRGSAFSDADVIVIVGTPFDFRMGYGRRISTKLKLVQIDMDYRTVGKNRDIDLGLVGDPGAILGAVLQAASGRLKQDKRQARQQWMKKLSDAESAATEKLMPLFKSNACRSIRTASPMSSTSSWPTTPSTSATAATW
jgi:acetolactate synthase-1/2/3 large subunit